MIRSLMVASVMAMTLGAAPAFADGKIYVQLPDLTGYEGQRAEDFLHSVVLANVVSGNCPGFEVSEEEWSLLTDSGDILAREQLKLSVDDYDTNFYQPAFAKLDDPDTCAKEGPNVEPVLDELVNLGGSRDALPDQDAAYEAFSAREASWDAPAGKTKTK
jgi:hypothetical protein